MTEVVLGFSVKPKVFYRKAIQRAADELGIKVTLKDLSSADQVRWQRLDALVLPGGPDIDPCYYMSQIDEDLRDHIRKNRALSHDTKKSKKRDAFEHALLMELFHNRSLRKLPVLGICRGMQMLAVSQGVPLYLDLRIETGMVFSKLEYVNVEVVEGSRFHGITEASEFKALKYQHQGIRLPYFLGHRERWPNIEISAYSHTHRMVEAIEFTDRPIMGVQFHPELTLDAAPRKVFNWILKEAAARSESRKLIFEQEHTY